MVSGRQLSWMQLALHLSQIIYLSLFVDERKVHEAKFDTLRSRMEPEFGAAESLGISTPVKRPLLSDKMKMARLILSMSKAIVILATLA